MEMSENYLFIKKKKKKLLQPMISKFIDPLTKVIQSNIKGQGHYLTIAKGHSIFKL